MTRRVARLMAPLVILLLPCALFALGSPGDKPRPPLRVLIEPLEEGLLPEGIEPGEIIELKISVLSHADSDEVRVEVKGEKGAEIIRGETSWSGPMKKGEEKVLVIEVRAPEKGIGEVRARASMPPAFKAQAKYRLGPAPEKEGEKTPPVKKDGRGRDIIEYPAR